LLIGTSVRAGEARDDIDDRDAVETERIPSREQSELVEDAATCTETTGRLSVEVVHQANGAVLGALAVPEVAGAAS
jgi:hypothetical protein